PAAKLRMRIFPDFQTAGTPISVSVEALDSEDLRATAYNGMVYFSTITAGDPEMEDTDNTPDELYGLPKRFQFTNVYKGTYT
ncbi:hypothetical protein NL529_32470, partial [Klebsiella pneumoniae]|nr:hypothetical protein [Klebsiella pneumoniae]